MNWLEGLETQLIDFIKGLMQPSITVMAMMIVIYVLLTGKTGAPYDQLLWLSYGVVGFWFGKTVGLFGNGKAPESIADTNKDLVSVIKGQQNVINNQSIDLGASVPVAVVQNGTTPVVTPVTSAATTTATAPADNDNPDTVLAQLAADLDKES